MGRGKLLGLLLPIVACHAPVQAGPFIDGDPTGIGNPSAVVRTFSEVSGLAPGDSITNQFAAFGVTFPPPGLFLLSPSVSFPPYSLANFHFETGVHHNPVSVRFVQQLIDVAFAFQTNNGATIGFSAFLDNSFIKSFQADTQSAETRYYGFTGLVLDEIRIAIIAPSQLDPGYFQLDNLQFVRASIAEPSVLALFGLGFAGLLIRKRRATA